MIKKLWDTYHRLTDPYLRWFWRIKPVWFRNVLTNVGHGSVVFCLTYLGSWLGLFGAVLVGLAGVLGYYLKETLIDPRYDKSDGLNTERRQWDRFGDWVLPVIGYALGLAVFV